MVLRTKIEVTESSIQLISKFKKYKSSSIANFVYYGKTPLVHCYLNNSPYSHPPPILPGQVYRNYTVPLVRRTFRCLCIKLLTAIEFFTVCTKLAEMAILYSKGLTKAKKKLPPVGLDLMLQIITGLGVQCLTR